MYRRYLHQHREDAIGNIWDHNTHKAGESSHNTNGIPPGGWPVDVNNDNNPLPYAQSKDIVGHAGSWMAESATTNGWLIGAVASAVAGVALLGLSAKKAATSVPV